MLLLEGTCVEPRAGGPDIYVTQWDNGELMENTLQALHMCYVAAVNGNGTKITALSVISTDGTARSLEPLSQFGLTVRCPKMSRFSPANRQSQILRVPRVSKDFRTA